jgi:hypothetical protein
MGTLWHEPVLRDENVFARFAEPEVEDAPPGTVPVARPEEPPPADAQDPARLVREGSLTRADEIVDRLLDAYLPGGVSSPARSRLIAFVNEGKPSAAALNRRVRETVHAILSMPEYQLA